MTRIVMEHLMHLSRVDEILRGDSEVPDFIPAKADAIVARLLDGEPIQYIVGSARFCGLELEVTPAVLIPRPETEQLVDLISDERGRFSGQRVLDCGTGSGCIALALARALRFADVTAIDLSDGALEVARRNNSALKAGVELVKADMLDAASMPAGEFDVIVSNPPYVLESEKDAMESNVLDHEPAMALFVPDADPMRFYEAVTAYAADHLANDGAIYFEINPLEADKFGPMAASYGFEETEIITDYRGARRFARITRRR